ncbi:hypothetical protein ACVWZZ_001191 [Bradyrhizobium sp. LM6.10]
MSAAMLKVLAATSMATSVSTAQRGAICITLAASPLPVTRPIRALTSWMAIMNGVVRNTVQSKP